MQRQRYRACGGTDPHQEGPGRAGCVQRGLLEQKQSREDPVCGAWFVGGEAGHQGRAGLCGSEGKQVTRLRWRQEQSSWRSEQGQEHSHNRPRAPSQRTEALTGADGESQGGTRGISLDTGGMKGISQCHGGSLGRLPDCLSLGRGGSWKRADLGHTASHLLPRALPSPQPQFTRPPKSSPAKLQTHLLQQGESYPGRVLTVSNDHS